MCVPEVYRLGDLSSLEQHADEGVRRFSPESRLKGMLTAYGLGCAETRGSLHDRVVVAHPVLLMAAL